MALRQPPAAQAGAAIKKRKGKKDAVWSEPRIKPPKKAIWLSGAPKPKY